MENQIKSKIFPKNIDIVNIFTQKYNFIVLKQL
jgi:hypothetical protein